MVDYSENEMIQWLEEEYHIKFDFRHAQWGEENAATDRNVFIGGLL